jgi:hypothetical protein
MKLYKFHTMIFCTSESLKNHISLIYSPSKCLVWVKKYYHVWLDQNFDPSLLTNNLLLVFMGMRQKKIKMANSKNEIGDYSKVL